MRGIGILMSLELHAAVQNSLTHKIQMDLRFSLPPGLELKVLQPLRVAAQRRPDEQSQAFHPGGQPSDGQEISPSHATVAGNARDNSEGSGLMKLFGEALNVCYWMQISVVMLECYLLFLLCLVSPLIIIIISAFR